ncbi:MAG: tRNA (adenosine(37)-N6)-threonylcarbamoyltransferase complex ATPase subunit type 1 TsaE [Patescibacteria group bacterium]|nr:tRNA (adenosine(37)-N6)-threonylcarbamoyltransferase complex ATPase subunit type 1 TsaE [Patescibacteria group bacterium]
MPVVISSNLQQTTDAAKRWLEEVSKMPLHGQARVVAMLGDLGSGKTTFVQAVARELRIVENVVSPTFVIEKIYHLLPPTQRPGQAATSFEHLIHIDCYRLDNPQELQHLGWKEIAANERNLIMIEWADKIRRLLPPDHLTLNFKFVDEDTRNISW